MKPETVDALVADALAIEAEDAREAGALGFMARAMVAATLPHRRTAELRHVRRNGDYALTMTAGHDGIGLPYGSVPRLLLAWIGAEALRTDSRELTLGDSMSAFLAELGLNRTGGRWGDVTRLKDQTRRLFACVVTCSYTSAARDVLVEPFGIGTASLWWEPRSPDQGALWQSTVILSERFHREITEHPVPVDLRALRALRRSPMALDLYAFTTYRMSTIRRPTPIPWRALAAQFGAGYPDTAQGLRDFRKALLRHLRSVLVVYPDARVEATDDGLLLRPSPTHVARRPARRPRVVGKG